MKKSALPLAVALLLAIAASTVVGLILGSFPGGLDRLRAVTSLFLGLLVGCTAFFLTAKRETDPAPPITPWQAVMMAVFAVASLRGFLWLAYESGDSLQVGSPLNLGDLALHLNLIHHLSSGIQFWPESTIFIEGPMRYPIGADLFNAVLLAAGVPVLLGLVWVGLLGSALTAFALRRWGGALALAALLFNGGTVAFESWPPVFPTSFTEGVEWKNLFLAVFITQRGFLWALPAGLLLLCSWKKRLEGNASPLPLWIEIFLYASMPLFHLHTFLFFSLALVFVFLATDEKGPRIAFLGTGFCALIPAGILVWLVTGGFAVTDSTAYAPGWMQEKWGPIFWWRNFGISVPLLAALGAVVTWKGTSSERAFVCVALVTFCLCLVFRFAPWPWDNIKLMLWSWLVCIPFLWNRLLQPLFWPARYCLVVLLFFSGALTLIEGLSPRHQYGLIPREEISSVRELTRDLPLSSRFAIAPDFSHPVLILGYRLALGYPGHLWTHGYNYRPTETALANFYRNPPKSGALPEELEKLTHVFVGPRERKAYGQDIWEIPPRGWEKIRETDSATIFEKNP